MFTIWIKPIAVTNEEALHTIYVWHENHIVVSWPKDEAVRAHVGAFAGQFYYMS